MPGEIFDFEWYVHESGYCWLETDVVVDRSEPAAVPEREKKNSKMPWITVCGETTSRNLLARRKYYPLWEYSCLFRTFSETDLEPEAVLGFANKYGLLGVELDAIAARRKPFMGIAEPYATWELELSSMRRALGLWDMVSADDLGGVEAYLRPFMDVIKADIDGKAESRGEQIESLAASVDPGELRWFRTHPGILELYAKGDIAMIASNRVQAIVNERLEARVSPRILWDDYRRRQWGLYFVPENLIGAIWIQFAQAITQNKNYRRCRQCDSWFEIDHYKARTNRYFCSNACRSKAYRERQAEARKMREDGVSCEVIAEKIGSDVETVKKWIEKE